ncbi:MAG: protease PrsW [Phycisphaerae bacterium]|nr:MAG: protease PrsW [Phycisphaerae bacterium]
MAPFALACILSFIPAFFYSAILFYLDRFEREPKRLIVAAFAWGAIVATTGAVIGTFVLQWGVKAFTGDDAMAEVTGTVLFAPIVEELTKGAAVFLVFWFFRHEFDSVLDGMVYGGVTALGFAATENVLYLYFKGYEEGGGLSGMLSLFVLRVILGGWMHAAYTAVFGAGLAIARLTRSAFVRVAAPLAGLGIAMGMHALHNSMATFLVEHAGAGGLLATLAVDWIGWALVFGMFLMALAQERRWLRTYLAEEVQSGFITADEYAVAVSVRSQLSARLRIRGAKAFYQALAELSQKKHQLAKLGDERGNAARVESIRAAIVALRSGPA